MVGIVGCVDVVEDLDWLTIGTVALVELKRLNIEWLDSQIVEMSGLVDMVEWRK